MVLTAVSSRAPGMSDQDTAFCVRIVAIKGLMNWLLCFKSLAAVLIYKRRYGVAPPTLTTYT